MQMAGRCDLTRSKRQPRWLAGISSYKGELMRLTSFCLSIEAVHISVVGMQLCTSIQASKGVMFSYSALNDEVLYSGMHRLQSPWSAFTFP